MGGKENPQKGGRRIGLTRSLREAKSRQKTRPVGAQPTWEKRDPQILKTRSWSRKTKINMWARKFSRLVLKRFQRSLAYCDRARVALARKIYSHNTDTDDHLHKSIFLVTIAVYFFGGNFFFPINFWGWQVRRKVSPFWQWRNAAGDDNVATRGSFRISTEKRLTHAILLTVGLRSLLGWVRRLAPVRVSVWLSVSVCVVNRGMIHRQMDEFCWRPGRGNLIFGQVVERQVVPDSRLMSWIMRAKLFEVVGSYVVEI